MDRLEAVFWAYVSASVFNAVAWLYVLYSSTAPRIVSLLLWYCTQLALTISSCLAIKWAERRAKSVRA